MQYVNISLDQGQRPAKGDTMFGNTIIEVEDFRLNHYIHHFDECDGEHVRYNDEYECIEAAADLIEEILWS